MAAMVEARAQQRVAAYEKSANALADQVVKLRREEQLVRGRIAAALAMEEDIRAEQAEAIPVSTS